MLRFYQLYQLPLLTEKKSEILVESICENTGKKMCCAEDNTQEKESKQGSLNRVCGVLYQ